MDMITAVTMTADKIMWTVLFLHGGQPFEITRGPNGEEIVDSFLLKYSIKKEKNTIFFNNMPDFIMFMNSPDYHSQPDKLSL